MIIRTHKDFKNWSKVLTLLLALLTISQARADETSQLNIKPARCIALHEGQVCYQKITINWTADVVDTYCLHQQDSKAPLMCWDNLASAKWTYEFEGKATQKFLLLRKQDGKVIAEAAIEVAWVYDASSRRESHWRIF